VRVCGSSQFMGTTQDCLNSPIGALVDVRVHNVETLLTNGLDAMLRYEVSTTVGRFNLGLESNYILRYTKSDSPGDCMERLRIDSHKPIGLHVHGSLGWDWRWLWMTVEAYHQGNYRNAVVDPLGHLDIQSVRTWTTINTTIGYAISTGWFL